MWQLKFVADYGLINRCTGYDIFVTLYTVYFLCVEKPFCKGNAKLLVVYILNMHSFLFNLIKTGAQFFFFL